MACVHAGATWWIEKRLNEAWLERIVIHDAHAAMLRTAERYISALQKIPD